MADNADNLIASGDASKFKPFQVHYEHGRQKDWHGDAPPNWSFDWPNETVSGDALVPAEDVEGSKALGLRKLEGQGALQCSQSPVRLAGGKTYVLKIDYLTRGEGAVRLQAPDSAREKCQSFDVALAETGGKWKSMELQLHPRGDGEYKLTLECYANGADKAVYFKSLSLRAQ